ncbi:hypothetical protein GOBAR_AA17292 [Gossypium barbadense]|uniref:Uncharacterized protein n=1 Tax=Gossypium barbadense TaxID=3634 RepID=A0A2P5XJ99_GOSBA|nr:hypothetical protein GOBAR_AA17292 [Gossypium barbadense]
MLTKILRELEYARRLIGLVYASKFDDMEYASKSGEMVYDSRSGELVFHSWFNELVFVHRLGEEEIASGLDKIVFSKGPGELRQWDWRTVFTELGQE